MTPEKLMELVEFYGSARASYTLAHAANDPEAAANFATESLTALLTVKAEVERQAAEMAAMVDRLETARAERDVWRDSHGELGRNLADARLALARVTGERDDALATIRALVGHPAGEKLVALTMTPDAGRLFRAALNYAAARIPRAAVVQDDDEMDHADWLLWAASRLDAVMRKHSEPSGTEASR